ncbi:MAG: hypothetical protein Q8P83_01455 [bacterium]|nr:hypothetical protein [bacterium]
MITNPHRKMRIKEFTDKDHQVMDRYYELLDTNLSKKQLKQEMESLIKEDSFFFDPYIILADIFYREKKVEQADELLEQGYDKAVWSIADHKGNWPEEVAWGWLENRHILRIISRYAYRIWEENKVDEALGIFRRLFQVNTNDNQGIRYAILAIRLGLDSDWDLKFWGEYKGQVLGLDAQKVDSWFEQNSKKFPEEFTAWFKQMEEYEG